jgi:hypothetical protein
MVASSTPTAAPTSQGPLLRPVKGHSSHINTKHLETRREAENVFQWVAYRAQEINTYFIQPLKKEIEDFYFEELGEWTGKLFSGAGRPLSPIKVDRLIEESFANAKKISQVAMLPFTLVGNIQKGMATGRQAENTAAEIEANGLAIIAQSIADPATLTPEQNKWLMEHLERCFHGNTPTDSELDKSVKNLAELHLLSMQGRGRT